MAIVRITVACACVLGSGGYGRGQALDGAACDGTPGDAQGGGGWGCGRRDEACPTGPAGEDAPFATYSLEGIGQGMGVTAMNTIKFDAVAGSTGGGGVGADGGEDKAASGCVFTTADATNIGYNEIEVLTAAYSDPPADDCADPFKCIRCTTMVVGHICRIDCVGKLPADDVTDADSFDVTVTFVHSFTTDRPGPPGMIRFDGFADRWTEFLPEGALPDFITTDGCNGGAPDEMVLNNDDFLDINDLAAGELWVQAFGIDDTSLGGDCTISTILTASMPLTGVSNEGVTVDVTRGPISLYGAICNDSETEDDCPAPNYP